MKNTHTNHYVAVIAGLVVLGAGVTSYADYEQTTTTTVTTKKNVPTTYVGPSTPEHQNITFDVKMQSIYQSNQRVRGDVVIHNSSSMPVAADFHIKLYHQGTFEKEVQTSVLNILPGENVFSLDKLGISEINKSAANQGDWTIVVYPSDLGPDYSKEAKFRVLSSF